METGLYVQYEIYTEDLFTTLTLLNVHKFAPSKVNIYTNGITENLKKTMALCSIYVDGFSTIRVLYRGRILGRNWDKSLKSFFQCYSQSSLY